MGFFVCDDCNVLSASCVSIVYDCDTHHICNFGRKCVVLYNRFKGDDKARMKIAKNGRKKYFELFECQKISDYIVSKSFNRETSKRLKWMD